MKFTKEHEWVLRDGEIVTVGITRHAQEMLGELVYVEMPAIEKTFKQGDVVGIVESVKVASEIYSPMAGTITDINQNVVEEPKLLNTNSEDLGWLFKMRVANAQEYESLLSKDDYEKLLNSTS